MPANDDLCDECGYHRILKKVLDTSGVYRPPKEVGFDRWFLGTLNEGESWATIRPWAIAIAGVVALIFFILFFPWSCFLLVIFGGLGIAWWGLSRQSRAARGESHPTIPLAPLLLVLVRLTRWRAPYAPFPKLEVADLSGSAISDDELGDLPLEGVGALDLERTEISDAGLIALEDARKLQYLVLRGTRVTPQGVARLQKKLPDTWIWS